MAIADPSLSRLRERLIDLIALAMLLSFAYLMRTSAPELAGGIAVAACAFWLTKNASTPHSSVEEAAAIAAAKVLEVAEANKTQATPVTVVDQPVQVEVKD